MRFIIAFAIFATFGVVAWVRDHATTAPASAPTLHQVAEANQLNDMLGRVDEATEVASLVEGGGLLRDRVTGARVTGVVVDREDDGAIRVAAEVESGRLHGPLIVFHDSGSVRIVAVFNHGYVQSFIEYDNQGDPARYGPGLGVAPYGSPLGENELFRHLGVAG